MASISRRFRRERPIRLTAIGFNREGSPVPHRMHRFDRRPRHTPCSVCPMRRVAAAQATSIGQRLVPDPVQCSPRLESSSPCGVYQPHSVCRVTDRRPPRSRRRRMTGPASISASTQAIRSGGQQLSTTGQAACGEHRQRRGRCTPGQVCSRSRRASSAAANRPVTLARPTRTREDELENDIPIRYCRDTISS